MNARTRRRIASDIADLDAPTGIAEGFDEFDIEVTIKRMEIRADHDLDAYKALVQETADGLPKDWEKDYSTLLLAACRYTAAINGQVAAAIELEAASDHLITLGAF